MMSSSPLARRPVRLSRLAPVAVVAAMLLAGCAGKSPPQRLLALPTPSLPAAAPSDGSPSAAPAPAPAALVLLQVGRLDIPEYWQSRAVRFRQGDQRIDAWPHTLWAERVEVAMSRHLAVELASRLPPSWQLCTDACRSDGVAAVRLLVTLPVLDYVREDRALTAWARWSFQGLADPQARTFSQTLKAQAPADSPEGQAQAMAALIGQLAGEVAARLPADGLLVRPTNATAASTATPAASAAAPRR